MRIEVGAEAPASSPRQAHDTSPRCFIPCCQLTKLANQFTRPFKNRHLVSLSSLLIHFVTNSSHPEPALACPRASSGQPSAFLASPRHSLPARACSHEAEPALANPRQPHSLCPLSSFFCSTHALGMRATCVFLTNAGAHSCDSIQIKCRC